MSEVNKPGLVFLAVVGIIIVGYLIYGTKRDKEIYRTYFDKFDLEFKGVLVAIQKHDHDRAKCIIRVTSSNKKEHIDSGKLWWNYCTLRNDTAYMELTHAHCLKLGDSIFIGPGNRYLIKVNTDTLLNFPNGVDNCRTYRNESLKE